MRWICSLLLLIAATGWAQEPIRLAASEFPPYFGPDLPNGGPLTEVVIAAFAAVGYPVKISFYPFSRALKQAEQCRVDGLFTAWDSPERRQWGLFSDPIPPANEIGFYQRSDQMVLFKALEQRLRIGIVRDYLLPEALNHPGIELIRVTEDLTAFRMLSRGRLDLVLTDRGVAQHLVRTTLSQEADPEALNWLGPPLITYTQHLLLCKKGPDAQQRLDAFNRGLRLLASQGKIEAILRRHRLLPANSSTRVRLPPIGAALLNRHWPWLDNPAR